MNINNILQSTFYLVALTALAYPLGLYMARVYSGTAPVLERVFGPFERFLYRVTFARPEREMDWKTYAWAFMLFNVLGLLVVYALQRMQASLPLNPMAMAGVTPDSSFNTAVSFASNTNWQGYGGETTMSYLTQMLGLGVQNFVSAASGMAVLVAFIRGVVRKETTGIGNFWVDLTRSTLYILLPLSVIVALVLVSQGVVQTFEAYAKVQLLQSTTQTVDNRTTTVLEQVIALGPAASQVAIKQLGTNGGGFFNVNSSHPLENPTMLTNFFQGIAILLIGGALCFTYGEMVKDRRQGWSLYAAMTIVFVGCLAFALVNEQSGNPTFDKQGVERAYGSGHSGGNMEGKEARFGIAQSVIWATATTAASNGSVNSMHDSYMPLGGLIPMALMQFGEVIYGGVGSGLYGMLLFVIIAVFIAGLMVGRTPEYMGKKIEVFEMKMASIGILVPLAVVLVGTAVAVVLPDGVKGMANPGAHGFSEVLYAFSSAGNNNGSAFAGLSANTPFYNTLLGLAMFFARYWIAVPVLAIAGALASKKIVPVGPGTLPTHTPLFTVFLIGVVLLVGVLTFLPAWALGPIVEHLQLPR